MTPREAGMYRWLSQMYNNRGMGLPDAAWAKFAKFCEANRITDEPTPGKRVDGRDPWDVFEERLKEGQ